jgi:hypothetical protein
MRIQRFGSMAIVLAIFGGLVANSWAGNETKSVIRGWLADESCAKNRASAGKYTMTSLTCAKECVSKGKKIALVDLEGKRVLVVVNQETVASNLGNYVEITGEVDTQGKTLHVDSLKFLDKNRAMCDVPEKSASPAKN